MASLVHIALCGCGNGRTARREEKGSSRCERTQRVFVVSRQVVLQAQRTRVSLLSHTPSHTQPIVTIQLA